MLDSGGILHVQFSHNTQMPTNTRYVYVLLLKHHLFNTQIENNTEDLDLLLC